MCPSSPTQYDYLLSCCLALAKISSSLPCFAPPVKLSRARTAPAQIHLTQVPENLVRDFNKTVPEIPRSFFETHLLPPSPLTTGVAIESISRSLCTLGTITRRRLWRDGSSTSIRPDHSRGDNVFGNFELLVEDILTSHQVLERGKVVKFVCNPRRTPISTQRAGSASKPDCYALHNGRSGHPRWLDIAVPGEFKESDGPEARNDVSLSLQIRLHTFTPTAL